MLPLTRHFRLHGALPRSAAALAAVVLIAGCDTAGVDEPTPATRSAPPVRASLHREAARAARAVADLEDAFRNGDVERLCTPGAIFTPAVVAAMNEGGESCEASVELSSELHRPPDLTVTRLALESGLATAHVRVGRGPTIPLDIVRSGRRWLVSFSNGIDPVGAVQRAMGF
jgi:hypothetical protein